MPLFLERLCVYTRRVGEELSKNKKIYATLPIAFLMLNTSPALADDSTNSASKLQLRTDTPRVVLVASSTPQIIPGESVAVKEARLKAEAEAAEKAKAEAAKKLASQTVVVSTASDPANFDDLYQAAGAAYGVDPLLLKAIHIIETGASGSTTRSNTSGATGPMQFLPSTFRAHAVDGNGDGIKSVYNVSDAVYTAAKYLVDCGYPDLKKALWGYNPSTSYYNKVVSIARSLGMQI